MSNEKVTNYANWRIGQVLLYLENQNRCETTSLQVADGALLLGFEKIGVLCAKGCPPVA